MTLEDAIKELAKSNIDDTNDWYSWRTLNEDELPDRIVVGIGNQYAKNLELKAKLCTKLKSAASHEQRKALIKYYISTWGGIHGNSNETMDIYTRSTSDELIARGSKGIASWSKALCISDPSKFAIFDARVSASLNALQIIKGTETPSLYPVLTSRNKVIKKGIKIFKEIAKKQSWEAAPELQFYATYLTCLENVALTFDKKLDVSVATVEMLLFAKAEELVKAAFTSETF